jgi:hypothetical protein
MSITNIKRPSTLVKPKERMITIVNEFYKRISSEKPYSTTQWNISQCGIFLAVVNIVVEIEELSVVNYNFVPSAGGSMMLKMNVRAHINALLTVQRHNHN